MSIFYKKIITMIGEAQTLPVKGVFMGFCINLELTC